MQLSTAAAEAHAALAAALPLLARATPPLVAAALPPPVRKPSASKGLGDGRVKTAREGEGERDNRGDERLMSTSRVCFSHLFFFLLVL